MEKNNDIFSKKYVDGIGTEALSKEKEISEDVPDIDKKEKNGYSSMENKKYGISKPIRNIIKGKISSD